ncbi:MAG: molybdopterin-binding protein [Desulfitobacteriaceae bacterium]
MKKVPTTNAIGLVLCQDITKIVPGQFKGRAFKKGHIITEADVPELLRLGKDHVFVWEQQLGMLHENEAAERLAKSVSGQNVLFSEVSEGKVNLTASVGGLLKVDRFLLEKVNFHDQVILATRHNNVMVQRGEILAGTRVVPLVIEEEKIVAIEQLCHMRYVLEVKPLQCFKVGVVVTGTEVYQGRITDAFSPVLKTKFAELGSEVVDTVYVPDDMEQIAATIRAYLARGVDMIAVSGGMSVDPDDLTPGAIKASGAEIIGYGTPVLPGSMLLIGYFGSVPIVGMPGCVMYSKVTALDLLLPRILTGERISKHDLVSLGFGGLCLNCPECSYPACPFGKS